MIGSIALFVFGMICGAMLGLMILSHFKKDPTVVLTELEALLKDAEPPVKAAFEKLKAAVK